MLVISLTPIPVALVALTEQVRVSQDVLVSCWYSLFIGAAVGVIQCAQKPWLQRSKLHRQEVLRLHPANVFLEAQLVTALPLVTQHCTFHVGPTRVSKEN